MRRRMDPLNRAMIDRNLGMIKLFLTQKGKPEIFKLMIENNFNNLQRVVANDPMSVNISDSDSGITPCI